MGRRGLTVKDKAEMVKKLRKDTSAGFVDCKKALERANFRYSDAIVWLELIKKNSPCVYCDYGYLNGFDSHRYLFCDMSDGECIQKNMKRK